MTQTRSKLQAAQAGEVLSGNKAQRTRSPRLYAGVGRFLSTWGLPALLLLIALGFNLYRLGVPSIWFDEAFSVELARQPMPLLWHIIFGSEPNMELYYLALHLWLGLTALLGLHDTEFVVRLPSAIFAALSTAVLFFLGRRFLGVTAALLGASLYLLNDLQLVYAQQARSYSLQLLFICLAWYALLVAVTKETRQWRWWICFVIATTLAAYAHLFSLLVLLSQLCALTILLLLPPWRPNVRRQLPALIASLIAITILSIPLFLVSLQGSKTGWLPSPHLSDVVHLLLSISGDNKIYLLALAACCSLGLLVAVLAYLPAAKSLFEQLALPRNGSEERRAELRRYLPTGLFLLCWLVVPVVVSYLVSQGSTRLFSPRYLVVVVPALCLLAGMGIAALRWRQVQVALSLGLIALALYVVPLYYRSAQVEDWNATSFWTQNHYQTGDGLVCYDNAVEQGCQISVEYYLHAYPSAAHFTADSPGAFSWSTFSSPDPDAATDPTVLAAYSAKHPRIFFIVGRLADDASVARAQAAKSWLDSHYHFIAQIVTRTVTVRLYATSTTTKVA